MLKYVIYRCHCSSLFFYVDITKASVTLNLYATDCFKERNCEGNGTYVSDMDSCCTQVGSMYFFDYMTRTCKSCSGIASEPEYIIECLIRPPYVQVKIT